MDISTMTQIEITELDRITNRYDDYWERRTEMQLCFSGLKFSNRFEQICPEWDLDGAILNYPIGCRDLCTSPMKTQDVITKELGIPILLLETDHIDNRSYSAEAMRSRVEAFAEMLKVAKAAKS